MAKIEIEVLDNLLEKVKLIAEQSGRDVNSLLSDYLSNLAESGLDEADLMDGNLRALFDFSIGRVGRREAMDRLGVDGFRLSMMLREAGFPPPRASIERENEMLEEIRDIHLS